MTGRLSYFYMQLESAWLSLYTVRFRSLLAGLGITIGVAAVILVIAVGEGSRRKILDQIQSLGSNLLVVNPGSARAGSQNKAAYLKNEDAEIIRRKLGKSAIISPEVYGQVSVSRASLTRNATLLGAQPDFFRARNFYPSQGRPFMEGEDQAMRKVCLLGSELARQLFPAMDPVDKMVRINGDEYLVVGVLEPKGDFGWFHPDQLVVVPLSLAQKQVLGIDHLHSITVGVFSSKEMQEVNEEITMILRGRHRLSPKLPKDQLDFNIISQTELIKAFNKVNRTFTSFLAGIAVISLLVGGIGIMNIMLANLSERVGEIGIRKAVGAKRTDILWQFLLESLTLTMAGAALGVILGVAISVLLDMTGQWQTELRAWSMLVAAGFAIMVGLIFGIYPAWRASGLDPIEALRKE